MPKWIIAIIFIIAFPCAAFAQDDPSAMHTWVQQEFGVNVPDPAISHSWEKVPMLKSCDYEWSLRWKDARFQVKDKNENFYRISYDGITLTLDFTRAFNGFFGS